MKEIRALTGLRGLAALIVFVVHTRDNLAERGLHIDVPRILERLLMRGGPQVDIFFALSGFILTMIYRDQFSSAVSGASYLEFLQRRLARIYPLHLFMLMLVFVFVMAAHFTGAQTANGLDRFTLSSLPAHLMLVHAWGFLGPQAGTWNPPSWSISIEFLAYLVFPAFMLLIARHARRWPLIFFGAATAIGCLANWFTSWGLAGLPGISRGLTEFALGCATAFLLQEKIADLLRTALGSVLATSILVGAFLLVPDTGFAIGLATAPLLLALTGNNPVSRALDNRIVYFLGEISYSVYLGHFLFTSVAYRLVSMSWMQSGGLPLLLGFCCITAFVLGASTITYYAIERPGRNFLRRFSRRRQVA